MASLMAAEGCSPSWIAAQLGHSDGGVTAMRFYIHPEAQQLPQAIDEALNV